MFKPSIIMPGFVCLTAFCAQAEPQVWQGKIGSMPIVMEFDIDSTNNRVEGRYFYRKYSTDIWLLGEKTEDGKLHLAEYNGEDQEDKEAWRDKKNPGRVDFMLSPQGEGWQGEWKGIKASKALPITLKSLDKNALFTPNFDERKPSLYDLARLTGLRLKAGRKEKFMGYTLEWMEEPISKIEMFRVRNGFPDETLNRINALLEKRQWEGIDWYFECRIGNMRYFGRDEKDWFTQDITPRLLNTRFLSISIYTSLYSCGGSRDLNFDSPLNFNIETGKLLELEDLLWLGKGEAHFPRKANGDYEDYYFEYREKILGSWLAGTMLSLYPQEIEEWSENGDGCNYTNAETWGFYDVWYFTPKGIYINPSFGGYGRVCEYPKWSILPWHIVNQYPGRIKGKLP
jgi:hypothetical protein